MLLLLSCKNNGGVNSTGNSKQSAIVEQNCKLPCLMNITPGVTVWNNSGEDLRRLPVYPTDTEKYSGDRSEENYFGLWFGNQAKRNEKDSLSVRTLRSIAVDIEYDPQKYFDTTEYFKQIKDSTLESWIQTYSSERDSVLPFYVYILSREQRTWISFGLEGAKIEGDEIVACFPNPQIGVLHIRTWALSENERIWKDILQKDFYSYDSSEVSKLKLLTEVSSQNLKDTSLFNRTNNSTNCIKTSKYIWSSP